MFFYLIQLLFSNDNLFIILITRVNVQVHFNGKVPIFLGLFSILR